MPPRWLETGEGPEPEWLVLRTQAPAEPPATLADSEQLQLPETSAGALMRYLKVVERQTALAERQMALNERQMALFEQQAAHFWELYRSGK